MTRRFCLRCHYPLAAREAAHCPRCGLQYDPHRPETYGSEPMLLRWKFWFPGLVLAVVSGVISYAVVIKTGEMGVALFISVPVSFGAILGYATRARIWWTFFLLAVCIPGVVTALVSLNLAGFFCGFTLGLIFLAPSMAGVTAGWVLRMALKKTAWDQRHFLPVALFMLLPYGVELVENQFPQRRVVATVVTDLTIDATPREAWKSILFYEEVHHDPPLLARLLLPRPLHSEGARQETGDRTRCIYDEGHLTKQITQVDEDRRLAFDVAEQTIFVHDVKLLDGSFELISIDATRTRVRLTTRYEKLLRPVWIWSPFEEKVIHDLHGHVLEGMRRKAEGEETDPPDEEDRYQPPPEAADPIRAARLEATISIR